MLLKWLIKIECFIANVALYVIFCALATVNTHPGKDISTEWVTKHLLKHTYIYFTFSDTVQHSSTIIVWICPKPISGCSTVIHHKLQHITKVNVANKPRNVYSHLHPASLNVVSNYLLLRSVQCLPLDQRLNARADGKCPILNSIGMDRLNIYAFYTLSRALQNLYLHNLQAHPN